MLSINHALDLQFFARHGHRPHNKPWCRKIGLAWQILRSVYHGSVWEMPTCGVTRRNWGDRCMGLKGPTDGMDKPVSPGRPGPHPRLASLPPDRIIQAWLGLRFVHSPSGLCPLSDSRGSG